MPKRRSNDEGSIYFNAARDRWEAKVTVGRKSDGFKPDGTPRYKLVRKVLTGPTRKAVAARLAELRAATDQGLEPPDNRTTLADFAAWWQEHVLPTEGLAPASEATIRHTLRLYVLPHVGHRTLTGPRALTPGDVEQMVGALAADGYSHRIQRGARTTLSKLLRAAERHGLVARNVARLAAPPRDRGEARKLRALTGPQVRELIAAASVPSPGGYDWAPLIVVGVTTGLRPGELLALRWADVHLDGPEPRLAVRRAISHIGGTAVAKAPKRERSHRTVPLAPEAVAALRAWRRDQAAQRLAAGPLWSTDWPDLVFTADLGGPLRVDTYYNAVGRLGQACTAARTEAWEGDGRRGDPPDPFPAVTGHALRHTYATALLEAGTPLHHVAQLLGDASATVESTYSHVLRVKHEAVPALSALLRAP